MNLKQLGLEVVLAGFAALTGYVIYEYGLVGMLTVTFQNPVSVLLLVDLTISLVMVLGYQSRDAEQNRISIIPYALITLAFGSAGPLLYLIRRAGTERTEHAMKPRAANG